MERVFASPMAGLFVAESGALQVGLRAGQEAVVARNLAALPDNVPVTVAGLDLATFADDEGGGLAGIADSLGVDKDLQEALSFVAKVGEMVSGVISGVGFVMGALNFLGVFGKPEDPFNVLFERIDARLKTLLSATLAGSTLNTMQQVQELVGYARTAAKIADEHVRAGFPTDDLSIGRLSQADFNSRRAAETLAQDSYWMRVHDEQAIDQGKWLELIDRRAPVDHNLVWDYRYTLPLYFQTVFARVGVIHALNPDFDELRYRDEIMGYARQTRLIEARIRDGVAKKAALGPEYWELIKFRPLETGVADVYTGANTIRWWYPLDPTSTGDVVDPLAQDVFRRRGVPRNHHDYVVSHDDYMESLFWQLYRRIGMFSFWQITPDLEKLAGKYRPHSTDVHVIPDLEEYILTGDGFDPHAPAGEWLTYVPEPGRWEGMLRAQVAQTNSRRVSGYVDRGIAELKIAQPADIATEHDL